MAAVNALQWPVSCGKMLQVAYTQAPAGLTMRAALARWPLV